MIPGRHGHGTALPAPSTRSATSGPTGAVVEVSHLHKTFGEVTAADDVSFTVEPGEIFGILGPNGAGKTTTVECIAGTLLPDAGRIEVLGVDPARDRSFVRQRVGYQLQSAVLPAALRVDEAVGLFTSFYPDPLPVADLLELVGLRKERRQAFGQLSGGQQQRLSIALALVGSPEVIVLDELTTGLDPQGRRSIWRLIEEIRAAQVTVLIVSHYLDEVERLCDRLAIISAGCDRFVGTPAELRARAAASSGPLRTLEDAYVAFVDAVDQDCGGDK